MQRDCVSILRVRRFLSADGAAAMVDLEDQIVWDSCECLNRTPKSSIANILKQGLRDQAEMLLESDADEELLLSISFKSQVRPGSCACSHTAAPAATGFPPRLLPQVRLHSLLFAAPEDGRAPKKVKLFANRDNLDFDGAKDATPDHEFNFETSSFNQRLEVSAAQPFGARVLLPSVVALRGTSTYSATC